MACNNGAQFGHLKVDYENQQLSYWMTVQEIDCELNSFKHYCKSILGFDSLIQL